jgi:hypothetical protein
MATATTLNSDPRVQLPHSLIASDRVEGTPVRRPNGEKVGEIKRVMIDKLSGNVAYAVLSFGGFLGFLGIGERYHPVPWSALKYKSELSAYELDIPDEQLRKGPSFGEREDFDWGDRTRESELHDYYKTAPYWGI